MDEETLTAWLDTALLMLGGFVLMTIMMLVAVNPPAKSSEVDGVAAPGNVIIEAQWGDQLDADVDLWVLAPGDVSVGYSNKSGRIFNLLRDDLGRAQDVTDYNHETAYSRGTPAGETPCLVASPARSTWISSSGVRPDSWATVSTFSISSTLSTP